MKVNAFNRRANDVYTAARGGVTAAEMQDIIATMQSMGTMSEAVLAHADDYGIANINWLFPEAKLTNPEPEWLKRDTDWVSTVMSGVKKSAFSRIKSLFADITEDEARAKGYIKGNYKKEEVFTLLKRTTSPTTVYKKQKLDKDDIIDITDFNVVGWIKSEMRMMLDEELARAFLIGDGRLSSSDDKIKEDNIRPIAYDDDFFTIKAKCNYSGADGAPKKFFEAAIRARKNYRGSGNLTCFTTEDVLTDLLLIEDTIGHRMYKTEDEVATAMRCTRIVTVPVMEGIKMRNVKQDPILAILVNLNDYTVGADRGGSVNMFEDFDIDYNQNKYLIETRCSGALTKPFSAIVIYDSAA